MKLHHSTSSLSRVHWRAPGRLGLLLALSFLLASSLTIGTFLTHPTSAHADTWSTLQAILARDTSIATSPPTATPSSHVPDGALMGNGHMVAAVGGNAAAQTYYIDATDFWDNAKPQTIGGLTVSIPDLSASGTTYQQAQDIGNAEVRSTFANSSATITERSWISATEDTMVLFLSNASNSSASPSVTVKTFTGAQTSLPTTAGVLSSGPNTMWATRTTNSSTWLANAALATRVLNSSSVSYSTDNSASASASFTLSPGQSIILATVLGDSAGNVSGSPWPAPATLSTELAKAQARVAQLNATAGDSNSVLDSDALHTSHLQWWKNFWLNGASLDLGGGIIERYWYTSLYAMAASNRSGFTAPGMQNFITTDNPDWNGNWTLDYNLEMPYQGLYAANHIELTQPYERGVIDCMPGAEANATANGFQGVYYPNNSAVGGQNCTGSSLKMKGNAAWLATNFVSHWDYTHDTTWAQNTGYPYLIQVANFWDNDLTKDSNGVYNITGSAQNENSSYQLNPDGDLAWLHYMYPALLQMSQALNVDSSRRAKWQDIITNLAPYPTFTNNNHTDFKATQDAPGFYGGDANPANAAFPGNDIGLGSSVQNIITEQNTIEDLNVWCQGNSFAWIFPAAARVGLPDTYSRLNSYLNGGCGSSEPGARGNTTVYQWGGGAETFGNMETVNSMLLSSYDGTIRLFPDWPAAHNASFTNMLASGNFTVSSSLSSGVVQPTTITSNIGGTLTVDSPWSPGTIAITDVTGGGHTTITPSTNGNLVSFATTSGHTYQLSGTGYHNYTRIDLARLATPTASSSHEGNGWSVNNINDGQEQSTSSSLGWSSSDANTGSNHTEWVQLNLGQQLPFDEVDLFPRTDSPNAGYGFPIDFTIAVSNDGSSWTTVVSKTGYALPSGKQTFGFATQTARYIRVTGTNLRANPNDSNFYRMQFAEMEVYAATNLALGATPSASSSHEGGGWSVAYVNDGSLTTGWSSGDANTGSNHTEWVQLDFGSPLSFSTADLYPRTDSPNAGYGFPIDFTIAVSNDGSSWATVVTKTGYPLPTGVQSFSFTSQTARYLRVTGTNLRANPNDSNYYRMQLMEISVH